MLQTLELARLRDYDPPAARGPADRAARSGPTGLELVEVPAGPFDDRRARASGFAYDNERPRHVTRRARVPDRPHADHQRHLPPLRRGRRLPAPRVVDRRGLALEGAVRHHPPPALDGRRARVANRAAACRSTRASPSSTSPGSRPTPSPARTERASRPRWSGRRRRPGTRRPGPARPYPWGDPGPDHANARTSTSSRSAPHPVGAHPEGASAERLPGDARRRVGVDDAAASTATPASARTPTASTPRCSSAATTGCCAAARGPPRARVATPTFRNWDLPAAPPDLRRLPDREGRVNHRPS